MAPPIGAASKSDLALEQAVNNFRTWFNIEVSKENVVSTAIKMEQDYYAAFKACTPGAYRYVVFDPNYTSDGLPVISLASAKIAGLTAGKCQIILNPDTSNNSECLFSPASVTAIVNMHNANIKGAVTDDIAAKALQALDDCKS